MRGRIGGRIGTTLLPSPAYSYSGYSSQGSAKGVWSVGQVYDASRGYIGGGYDYYGGSTWPTNTLTVEWPNAGYYGGYALIDYIDATVTGGGTFSPTVETNYAAVSYSWEQSTDDGDTWTTVAGETEPSLTLSGLTLADDGTKYRLLADAGLKQVYSSPGSVRFDTVTVSITSQPYNTTADSYAYFDCSAQATGITYGATYETTYQWQRSTDGGSTWTNISGATSSTVGITVTSSDMDGYKYRCVASFADQTATSNAATLTYGEGEWWW